MSHGGNTMNVLFFYPKPSLSKRSYQTFPLGVLSIASYLQNKGHTVKIIDRSFDSTNIQKTINEFSPALVGITVMSAVVYDDAIKISKICKKNNLPVAWGGFIASALYECALKEPCVDYVVRGEGELTFEELINSIENNLDISTVDGIAFKKDGAVVLNRDREFADLASFPLTDWSLIDVERYLMPYTNCHRMAFIYTSKGCPGRCTFCYNKNYHKCVQRRRPIEHVIAEMEQLITQYQVDGFYFSDELFYYPPDEMNKFYEWKDQNYATAFVWGIQCRVNTYTYENFKTMYDHGCRWAFFGIEGGTVERIRKIKKGINFKQVKESLRACKEIGIDTDDSFIIGFPDEDEDELIETIQMIKNLGCENPSINIYFPQPESEEYYELINSGRYKKPESFKEYQRVSLGNESIVNFSKIPEKELKVVHYWSLWYSFFKKNASDANVPKDDMIDKNIVWVYIKTAFQRLFKYGVLEFAVFSWMNLKQYILVFWYAHAFPHILKKYNLDSFK